MEMGNEKKKRGKFNSNDIARIKFNTVCFMFWTHTSLRYVVNIKLSYARA